MANEYGDLEQLVNDVTSLDTARMTLRWALERLNTIEKDKADLKKNLTLAEETARKLQVKEASLQDTYSSRNKTLEEKEDFYTKLEATMSLLGEGKLDIQQLLKKEAKLDTLRKSLETEYSDKFEDLDRSQRSIIERWNTRLLDVEGQYAGRLAEAQKKYDSLRAELESEHQGRLTELQASFKHKEKELSDRISFLEVNVHQSEEKVETRRRELEAEYMAKKREMEENFRKLRNMLEAGMEEKLRAMDSDHSAQITSLEASWQGERARLLEEQRVREDQFLSAQDRIKEIENKLAAQHETHHSELLKLIAEKEAAFRAQLRDLEKEKSVTEATVRELQARLEKRAADWDSDRTRLQTEFDARVGTMEAGLQDRAAFLEKDYLERKQELDKEYGSRQETFNMNSRRVTELEDALHAANDAHYKELMQAKAEFNKELSFRVKELVGVQTADLLQALEASSARQKELSASLEEKESVANALKAAAETARRDNETRLVAAVSDATASSRAELEKAYARKENALEEEYRLRRAALEKEIADAGAANARASELSEKLLDAKKVFQAQKLETQAAYMKELDSTVSAAVDAAVEVSEQKLGKAQEELSAARNKIAELSEKLLSEEKARHDERMAMQREQAKEMDASVSAAVDAAVEVAEQKLGKAQEELFAARNKIAELSEKLLSEEKARHDERMAMQREQVKEMDASVYEAVSTAVQEYEQRLIHVQEELAKTKKEAREEVRLLEDVLVEEKTCAQKELAKAAKEARDEAAQLREMFAAEKARMLEEMDCRDRYIENADSKMQEMEREMLKYRQEASSELMRNISDQDIRFREAAAEEKARNEARIKQLEELVSAKEQLLVDSDRFYRQKQLELDGVHTSLNMRINESNKELFAQKQALSEKEKALNDYRLAIEKEHAQKMADLEQMKAELDLVIKDYKSRK